MHVNNVNMSSIITRNSAAAERQGDSVCINGDARWQGWNLVFGLV